MFLAISALLISMTLLAVLLHSAIAALIPSIGSCFAETGTVWWFLAELGDRGSDSLHWVALT